MTSADSVSRHLCTHTCPEIADYHVQAPVRSALNAVPAELEDLLGAPCYVQTSASALTARTNITHPRTNPVQGSEYSILHSITHRGRSCHKSRHAMGSKLVAWWVVSVVVLNGLEPFRGYTTDVLKSRGSILAPYTRSAVTDIPSIRFCWMALIYNLLSIVIWMNVSLRLASSAHSATPPTPKVILVALLYRKARLR